MRSSRIAFLIAGLMFVASIGAVVARPGTKATSPGPPISLETKIPKHFGSWREEPQRIAQMINPQSKELLDKLYSETLSRTYVNASGYRIMLSLAYGSDQRGALEAHRANPGRLATPFGEIPVRRLFTSKGAREEPVTYWFTMGDRAVQTWNTRLVELSYSLTGRIPDGLLFRVSSIDSDQARANQMQDQFVNQLLQAVSPAERKRLAGFGDS
jgi:EpsI family protein